MFSRWSPGGRRRLAAAAFAALGALAALGPPPGPRRAAAQDPPVPDPARVWVRGAKRIPDVIAGLRSQAQARGVAQVLVALDTVTFAPPPGLTEFTLRYGYFRDLDAWIEAFGAWARSGEVGNFRASSTCAPLSVDLSRPGSEETLAALVRRRWWGRNPTPFEPALTGIRRLVERTAHGARRADGTPGPRMLVWVTGDFPPEQVLPLEGTPPYESRWRTRLLAEGRHWQEEAIASYLLTAGVTLDVVAPEALFGEATPLVELPQMPWAARPQFPGSTNDSQGMGTAQPLPPLPRGWEFPPLPGLDPPGLPATGPGSPRGSPRSATRGAQTLLLGYHAPRFEASTPAWFPLVGHVVPFNNHAPSGYGRWELARTAARTGGRYFFYPWPAGQWLDRCPGDPAQLNRLAPELVTRQGFRDRRRGDRALDAIGRAMALVQPVTPHSLLPGPWAELERARPLRLASPRPRQAKPTETLGWSGWIPTFDEARRTGERLREETLPRYDAALAVLDEALGRLAAGERDGVHPRSEAHLELTAFWTAMSAFHLDALSRCLMEAADRVPVPPDELLQCLQVVYLPTIRLSDCLPAYDGRTLDLAQEARYPRWIPPGRLRYQGNLLRIPPEVPDYRAQRVLASVLRHLDPALGPRALAMIERARRLMRHHARTGWGWTTYYSEAFTFDLDPVWVPRGHRPQTGESQRPVPRPTTPSGRDRAGEATTPTGPTSGG